ncbi:phage tail tape measure protein [Pseudomonas mediterranea]|uniref:Phage tail tape measure protein, lambda family n=1 Tax=Pseudomonas mediterranea TaxID=183795 RepID=A0AAX2DED9_9PSED|nr:phage tail tape measure protein [Pseudomonas mediterranea]SDU61530.1 phage tail tape measure protein, lambda family [Pseudomonas mediterranea]
MDIASLGISIDTSDVAKATTDLEKVVDAGGRAEKAAESVSQGFEKAGNSAKRQRQDLDALLGKIDPLTKKLNDLANREQKLAEARSAGLIGAEAFTAYQQKIEQSFNALAGIGDAQKSAGTTADVSRKSIIALAEAAVTAGESQRNLASAATGLSEAQQGVLSSTKGLGSAYAESSRGMVAGASNEIAIIRQLDKAMSGNIDNMESLIRAEGLLEKARKGGLVTAEDQETYQVKLGKAYDQIEKAEAKETAQKQRLIDAENRQVEALKRTVNGIDPLVAKLAKLEAQEKALNDLQKSGGIDAETYADRLAKIGKDRSGLTATETAFDKLKLGTRQAQENVMQLTNALQSGDWGSGARAVAQLGAGAGASAKSLAAALIPAGLLAGVIGGLGYAYLDAVKQAREFNVAINGGSNDAGQSIASLKLMSDSAGVLTGNLAGAREAVVALASGAATSGIQMRNLAEAAAAIGEVTGKGAGDIAKSLANAGDTATDAAAKISDQYGLLTYEQYQTIKAIDEQGDHQRALDTLSENLNQSAQERLKNYRESLSDIERDWDRVKEAIKGAYSEVRSEIFPDLAKQIEITQRVLDTRNRGGVAGAVSNGLSSLNSFLGLDDGENDDSTAALEARLAALKARQAASESNAAAVSEETRANKELIEVQRELDRQMDNLSPLAKRQDAYKKLNDQFAKLYENAEKTRQKSPLLDGVEFDGKRFSGGAYDQLRKAIDDQNKDPKTASASVDLTAFNGSKNQLVAILDEYKNTQKELDAAQKAGLVSQADYLLKREALIGNERDEVTAAYQAEITALQEAKERKTTTAAQSIQLDQKIADARAAMVKAQQDADTELNVLATNEEGRLKKQTLAVDTYRGALQQQVETLREQGRRAAAGLGMGDRQRDLVNQQNGIDDRFDQQKLELANQYGDGSRGMSLDEYTQKLNALKATQQDLHDTVRANYDDMSAAQGSWSAGASSAWQNYLESARDVAGQTKSLFTNAFGSMEDALVNFAMTGKLSFADFAKSILADMARIATRAAASSALSSLFGLAASAAGSYFGGGATSAGSTQAGYSGDLSGFTPGSLQAKGGVWSGGVQLFANGAAFTNSIVNKPTAFGMAGGDIGVMGEAGEEAIMPLTRTAGGKLGVMAVGGGNGSSNNQVVIQQSFAVPEGQTGGGTDTSTSQAVAQAYARAAKQGAQEQIARDLRPGGQIWQAINGR